MTLGYYPFGLKQKGYNNTVNGGNDLAQNWKYNGVELNEDLGLNFYEMDLRHYDPAIGRWNVIDPVTHWDYSPYQAFDNNPIFWADPSGADSYKYNWDTGQYEQYDDDGVLLNDNANFNDALDWAESQNNWDDYADNSSANNGTTVNKASSGAGVLLGFVGEGLAEAEIATVAAGGGTAGGAAEGAGVAVASGMSATSMLLAASPLLLSGDTSPEQERRKRERIYVTYTKIGPNGEIYAGRASGFGTPQEIVARRDAAHHMNVLGFGPAVLDRFAKGLTFGHPAIRGREQQLIDLYGGALSDSSRRSNAVSANRIRGVSKYNPRGVGYHRAANATFGEIYKYTGSMALFSK